MNYKFKITSLLVTYTPICIYIYTLIYKCTYTHIYIFRRHDQSDEEFFLVIYAKVPDIFLSSFQI